MKGTRQPCLQLEDRRSPEGEKEGRWEERPREEMVHIGLVAWDTWPSALQLLPNLHTVFICLLLQSDEREEMLMHSFTQYLTSIFQ